MSEIIGAVIGTIAVIVIPLFNWLSHRVTREGRLLLRVNRFGATYALMPEGAERDAFARHLNRLIKELNEWLEPANKRRRRAQLVISVLIYIAGVAVALSLFSLIQTHPWVQVLIGGVAGGLIIWVQEFGSGLIERDKQRADQARRDEAEAARHEAIRRGEPFGA
jgi:uncharacterized membrane protein YbhN (UPF0104 family)